MTMKKKGFTPVIYGLVVAGIALMILAIVLGLGGKVVKDIAGGEIQLNGSSSTMANATGYAGLAINNMSSYLPLIGSLVVIVALLVILIVYLAKKFGGGGMG